MITKKCIGECQQEKPLEEFWKDKNNKDGKYNICKICANNYQKQWDLKNPGRFKETEDKRIKQNKEWIKEYLRNHPCVKCGEKDIRILEFHHINPKNKYGEISDINTFSLNIIKKEIEKCNVLCRNCHLEYHQIYNNSYKYKWLNNNLKLIILKASTNLITKICHNPKCKKEKPISEFGIDFREKDGLNNLCKECDYEYQRQYYLKNRHKVVANLNTPIKNWRRGEYNLSIGGQIYICEYLFTHPCVDCGEKNILVLEFDHLRNKEFGISQGIGYPLEKLQEEIQKCEVRCGNCHRKRHI